MAKIECPVSDKMEDIDSKVGQLHDGQFGSLRHKCAYCAFVKGFEQGYKTAKKQIILNVKKLEPPAKW